jgi:hypothetical protein
VIGFFSCMPYILIVAGMYSNIRQYPRWRFGGVSEDGIKQLKFCTSRSARLSYLNDFVWSYVKDIAHENSCLSIEKLPRQ